MKRVKLLFHERFQSSVASQRCWISIPEDYKYVSDLLHDISNRFLDIQDYRKNGVYLTIDQFSLLPNEGIDIIQSDDVIEVKLANNVHKKRHRKSKKRKLDGIFDEKMELSQHDSPSDSSECGKEVSSQQVTVLKAPLPQSQSQKAQTQKRSKGKGRESKKEVKLKEKEEEKKTVPSEPAVEHVRFRELSESEKDSSESECESDPNGLQSKPPTTTTTTTTAAVRTVKSPQARASQSSPASSSHPSVNAKPPPPPTPPPPTATKITPANRATGHNEAPNAYSFATPAPSPASDQGYSNRRINNTPAWLLAAINSKSGPNSTPSKVLVPPTPCPFLPATTVPAPATLRTPKGTSSHAAVQTRDQEQNRSTADSENEEEMVMAMGQESLCFPRPKRKYEVIVPNTPPADRRTQQRQQTHAAGDKDSTSRFLRVPVPHLYPFKCCDRIAYRTLSLCEETWNPILSEIIEGEVQVAEDSGISSEVIYTVTSLTVPDEVNTVTWRDISEAWLLVERSSVPPTPIAPPVTVDLDFQKKKASLLGMFAAS